MRFVPWIALVLTVTLGAGVFALPGFRITSFSMEPTLAQGDVVIVIPFLGSLGRGDVVIYIDPRLENHPFVVKRIVGLPNEQLAIRDDLVSVQTGEGELTFPKDSLLGRRNNGRDLSIVLGPEDYLLMGDNRPGSKDGRTTGTIQRHEMYGAILFRVTPLSRIGFIR